MESLGSTGLGISFLALGLTPALILLVTAAILALLFPTWRSRSFMIVAAIAALFAAPWLLVWPLLTWLHAPEALLQWWQLSIDGFGGQSIIAQNVRSAICAPMVGSDGEVLGVLYVDHRSLTHRYTDEDLGVLIAFAGIAGVAIENSRFAERIRREALVRSNFERFFAPSLAERIAALPGAARLGGERRQVAVLFSDIRDFTPLAEPMEPADVAALLTEYFTQMVECVFRHGGTLDKFMGDAVMAQWGAPIAADDDPDRALAAATDMQRALETLNERWRAQGRPAIGIGVGVAWGEVFAGNIGSERRMEYTIIGDTVNVAARLCKAAAPGEVLVTDDLRRVLRAPPPLTACPPLALRGKSQPVPVFRVER